MMDTLTFIHHLVGNSPIEDVTTEQLETINSYLLSKGLTSITTDYESHLHEFGAWWYTDRFTPSELQTQMNIAYEAQEYEKCIVLMFLQMARIYEI